MTALNPTPKAQPRKASPAKKQAPAKVTPLPTAENDAAEEQHPATAAKAPAKTATARVAPVAKADSKLPEPAKLTWETKEVNGVEYWVAEGARHLYRVHQGDDGGWHGSQKLKAGSWSPMAGKCPSREDAQTLAGFNEAGATWLSYRDVVGVPFEKLLEDYRS